MAIQKVKQKMSTLDLTYVSIGLATALAWCVIPFIIPDIIKIVLALIIIKGVRKFVKL
jgi:biotin transporter BioY